MSQTTDNPVNCLRGKAPRMPKANLAVESQKPEVFNGLLYWNLGTIKLNKTLEFGGVASPSKYQEITALYSDYTKSKILKQAYELDSNGQLHLHFISVSHKKVNCNYFIRYMRQKVENTASYTFYLNSILTQLHLSNAHRYLDKEDQLTVIERYNNLVLDIQSVLPNEEPEDLGPDEPIPSNFIVDFID